jgi:hypothetical protein
MLLLLWFSTSWWSSESAVCGLADTNIAGRVADIGRDSEYWGVRFTDQLTDARQEHV